MAWPTAEEMTFAAEHASKPGKRIILAGSKAAAEGHIKEWSWKDSDCFVPTAVRHIDVLRGTTLDYWSGGIWICTTWYSRPDRDFKNMLAAEVRMRLGVNIYDVAHDLDRRTLR